MFQQTRCTSGSLPAGRVVTPRALIALADYGASHVIRLTRLVQVVRRVKAETGNPMMDATDALQHLSAIEKAKWDVRYSK